MNEADLKRLFKISVRHHKGFCCSLGSNIVSGVPDLYMVMPNHKPLMLEAKLIKGVNSTFRRKINYSPLQKLFMHESNKAQTDVTFGLIGIKFDDVLYVAIPFNHIEYIDHNFKQYTAYVSKTPKQQYLDIPSMISRLKTGITVEGILA